MRSSCWGFWGLVRAPLRQTWKVHLVLKDLSTWQEDSSQRSESLGRAGLRKWGGVGSALEGMWVGWAYRAPIKPPTEARTEISGCDCWVFSSKIVISVGVCGPEGMIPVGRKDGFLPKGR